MTRLQQSLPGIVSVAAFFILWEVYCRVSGIPTLILPAPSRILSVFFQVLTERSTLYHLGVTLWEILAGFFIAVAAGMFLGWLIYVSPTMERGLHPFIVASQVVPKVALVPLFVLWFGFGSASKIIVAAVIAFFPVMVNTNLGLRSVDAGHRDVFKALKASPWQRIVLLQIPSALPAILAGMEMAIVLATIGAVVGEYLGGSEGLGYLAVATMNAFQTDRLFVIVILLTLIGFVLFLVIAALRSVLTAWHSEE